MRPPFAEFYQHHFLPEHRHPANVALHVAGTLASALAAAAALLSPWPWLALAWPLLHAAPGLLGHRLFERNAAVGDLRITRTDFPPHWFIAANHRLTAEVLLGRRR
jgi:hypothetical protein